MSYINLDHVSVIYSIHKTQQAKSQEKWKKLLQSVTQRYNRVPFYALNDISLSLESGDRLALLGESGAGKSTMLKLLAKFVVPSEGEYNSEGHITPYLEAKGSLLNYATGIENIRLRGYFYGYKNESLQSYIERTAEKSGLGDFLNSPVQKLSAGMRAKLLVSMLEIHAGEILLMDEWIGTTDKNSLDEGSTLYQAVMKAKIFVLASHNEDILKTFCNKGLVIQKGKMAFSGNIGEAIEFYKGSK